MNDEILKGLQADDTIRIVERRSHPKPDVGQILCAGLMVLACIYLVAASVTAVLFATLVPA